MQVHDEWQPADAGRRRSAPDILSAWLLECDWKSIDRSRAQRLRIVNIGSPGPRPQDAVEDGSPTLTNC